MVRISKQQERRNQSPKRRRRPVPKTGPKKDNLPLGYKEHQNAIEGGLTSMMFVPKVK